MNRSYEVIEDHMAHAVGHHSADNNHLHPNLRILVRCMVRNIRHLVVSNMDEYIRQDVDGIRCLLRNVTDLRTFLQITLLGVRRTRKISESF